MPSISALGRISVEKFKWGPQNFTTLSGTIGHKNVPDMTSPAASGQLQNVIEYCITVHKISTATKESNNSAMVGRKITA